VNVQVVVNLTAAIFLMYSSRGHLFWLSRNTKGLAI
jgi:hypothetical protein